MSHPPQHPSRKSPSAANDPGRLARGRRAGSLGLSVEPLEGRQLLTIVGTVTSPTSGVLTGDSNGQGEIIAQSGGLLTHQDGSGEMDDFVDEYDFDSSHSGSQHLTAGPSTTLGLVNGGSDSYDIHADTQNNSLDGTTINASGGAGAELDIENTPDSTTGPFTYTVQGKSITSSSVNFNLSGAPFGRGIHFYNSFGTVNILGTEAGEAIGSEQNEQTTYNIGDGTVDLSTAMQGSFSLNGPGGSLNIRDLTTAATNATVNGPFVTGLSAASGAIGLGTTEQELSLFGGNGGDNFTVVNPEAYATNLTTGTGNNVVTLEGQVGELNLDELGGTNLINIVDADGAINIPDTDVNGPTSIVADYSPLAPTVKSATLSRTNSLYDQLAGFTSDGISFETATTNTLTVKSGSQVDNQGNVGTLTVDFSNGNPIPTNGLTYDGAGVNTLTLQGGQTSFPYYVETYNATGPGAGNLAINGSPVQFSGLLTLVDTVPAMNYTFNDASGINGQIDIGPGPTVGGQATTSIDGFGTAQFARQEYANKSNVTINTGAGDDLVDLTASTLAKGTTTVLNGQGGSNTLNLEAGGATIQVEPDPTILGADEITSPSFGTLIVENFSTINLLDYRAEGPAIAPPTFGSIGTISGVIGMPLTDIDVATFTTSAPNATPASFTATITWADGTTSAGTIVADASTPTVYHVEGSHT